MLPLTLDEEILKQMVKEHDGFLLTGGQDVSPFMYGEKALPLCGESCPCRDEMENRLFTLALERDAPMLGICRGIQLMNVVLGGTLYQDIPSQYPSTIEHHQSPPYEKPIHEVKVVAGTPLAGLLGQDVLAVNGYHHQGIRELSARLHPMTYAPDGLAEAVYVPEKRYVWAVQWHPEFFFRKDESSKKIFQSFIRAAGQK